MVLRKDAAVAAGGLQSFSGLGGQQAAGVEWALSGGRALWLSRCALYGGGSAPVALWLAAVYTAGVLGLEDRPCALEMGIGLGGLTASVSSVYIHTATSTWRFGQNLGSTPELVSGL